MTHPKCRSDAGAFDSLLMLRPSSEGSLTTTGTCSGVQINETPADGMTAKISVPAAAATTTLLVEIEAAGTDADGSYIRVAASETISAAGAYCVRFATQRPYVRAKFSVAGTTPDFGAVEVGIVPHGF